MLWRWTELDPSFQALSRFRRRMYNLFDEFERGGQGRNYTGWPYTQLYETSDGYTLRAEVPGLKQEELKIEVQQNTVTIGGERGPDAPEGYSIHRQERPGGVFSRSFSFQSEVDPEKTTASLKNGILTIVLPRAATMKPRQIQVKAVWAQP